VPSKTEIGSICRNYSEMKKGDHSVYQSVVSKSSIAKWCCYISMFLTNHSPDLYA